MENSLERLEQIMKPYFDKQKEIEVLLNSNEKEAEEVKDKINELRAKRKEERTKLELRLERLRANKDREIDEYVSSQPGFYAGYAATVRKDLEQAYKVQEDELVAEIKSFDATTEKQIENLENSINSQSNRNYFIDMSESKELLNEISDTNKKLKEIKGRPNYIRVYLKEMIDLKGSLRKALIAEQKKITFELQREKINFDSVMLELSNFKYQYNDQHQVTNSLEWKELYEKSNQISSKINELRNSLKLVEKYLNLTELTKDELSIMAYGTLTPLEKEEYNRRKGISSEVTDESEKEVNKDLDEQNTEELTEESVESIETDSEENSKNVDEPEKEANKDLDEQNTEELTEENLESIETDSEENTDEYVDIYSEQPDDLVDSYTPVESDGKYTLEGNDTIVQNMEDLCDIIYNDLLYLVNGMDSIKIDKSSNPETNYFSEKSSGEENYSYVGKIKNQETLRLPNGELLNEKEVDQALDKFYKKNKGLNFTVIDQDKTYQVSRSQVRKLKKTLKKRCAMKLVQDQKLSDLDVKHVFVKGRQEALDNNVGKVATKMPEGIYLERDELKDRLREIFVTDKKKKREWLKTLSDKIKIMFAEELEAENGYEDEEIDNISTPIFDEVPEDLRKIR